MSTLVFDTYAFVKRLTTAGMPEAQAEILATEQANLIESRLATKQDIANVQKDIESLRREVDSKIDKLALQLTVRMGGMLVVAVGVLATVLRLMGMA